jgi:exopolysaccharide production protein ExoQ
MSAEATLSSHHALPSTALARSVAAAVPMLMIAYTLLVWPLLYATPAITQISAFQAPDADSAPFALTRAYVLILFLVSLATFLRVRPPVLGLQKNLLGWLGVFLAFAVLSAAWSLDPSYTLRKSLYQLVIVLTIFMAVLAAGDTRRILSLIFALMLVVVLANLEAVATRPPSPIGHAGIYTHKNSLGAAIALVFVFMLYFMLSGRRMTRVVALVASLACLFLLVKSESKTAIGLAALAPLCGVFLYLLVRWLRVSPLVAILFGLCVTVAVYLITSRLFGFDMSDILLVLFGDATFTGRTQIWAFVLDYIKQRPILGYGYQGFWGIPDSPKFRAELPFIASMAHGHNGFLDTILTEGVVGFALYLIIVGKVIRRCGMIAGRSASLAWFYLSILVMLCCSNLMESELLVSENASDMMFIILGFLASTPLVGAVAVPAGTVPQFVRPRVIEATP